MDTYSLTREFADSWGLLALFSFFLAAVVWAFLPSRRAEQEDASQIPFRNETAGCAKNCDACTCRFVFSEEPMDV